MKFFSKFLGPNKKIEQLIHILITNTNYDEVENFLMKQKKSFLTDLSEGEVIKQISKKPWSRKKYIAYVGLKEMIQIEGSRNTSKIEKHLCDIPPIYNDFHVYMYIYDVLALQGIPWEEWDDIAKLKIDALEDIFNKGELKGLFDERDGKADDGNYDAPLKYKSYRKFCDEYSKRCDELIKKGYMQILYASY